MPDPIHIATVGVDTASLVLDYLGHIFSRGPVYVTGEGLVFFDLHDLLRRANPTELIRTVHEEFRLNAFVIGSDYSRHLPHNLLSVVKQIDPQIQTIPFPAILSS